MPIALLIIGALLIVSGAEGKTKALGSHLASDFVGTNGSKGFAVWVLALVAIGAIGYVPRAKPLSDAFLALIIVVIFLDNNQNSSGFFANITEVINGTAVAQPSLAGTTQGG